MVSISGCIVLSDFVITGNDVVVPKFKVQFQYLLVGWRKTTKCFSI